MLIGVCLGVFQGVFPLTAELVMPSDLVMWKNNQSPYIQVKSPLVFSSNSHWLRMAAAGELLCWPQWQLEWVPADSGGSLQMALVQLCCQLVRFLNILRSCLLGTYAAFRNVTMTFDPLLNLDHLTQYSLKTKWLTYYRHFLRGVGVGGVIPKKS